VRSLLVATAVAVSLLPGARAHAQMPAPPPVVDLPDEPLPDWHPPRRQTASLFLTVAPQVHEAQRFRQVGLWISAIGWAQVLAGGIIYVAASSANQDLGQSHPVGFDIAQQMPIFSSAFDPALEDRRDRLQNASLSLFAIGGAMAGVGFIVYTIGQTKLSKWHHTHPHDPLPPLSGF
jgi:hypothetical protein